MLISYVCNFLFHDGKHLAEKKERRHLKLKMVDVCKTLLR